MKLSYPLLGSILLNPYHKIHLTVHMLKFCIFLCRSVQDHFARYPGHGLLATTHLLLKTGSGDRFNCALKWGIPAVSDE